jgi:hypothetical protein
MECPYTVNVLTMLGIHYLTPNDILGIFLNRWALEIISDILSHLISRHQVLPPEVLVRTTLQKYAKGVALT